MVYGAWGVGLGVWGLVYGAWCLGLGVWRLGCGVWRLVYGEWGVVFGVTCEGLRVWEQRFRFGTVRLACGCAGLVRHGRVSVVGVPRVVRGCERVAQRGVQLCI